MKGFNNIGNTCYLNSGLQMMVQNTNLCNLIYKYKDRSDILNNISNFIYEYYNSNKNSLTPKLIKNYVAETNNIFAGFGQQDSSEFILFFINLINDEINKVSSKKDKVYNIFGFNIHTRFKCKVIDCLNISTNNTKEIFLELDINDTCNVLDDCYRLFKSRTVLDDDNKYFCEKCNKKRKASKRTSITHYPNDLIIVLKRFKFNGRRYEKNNQEIKIPTEWKQGYILNGFCFHSGSVNGGHYTYVGLNNDEWYLYNDSSVSKLNDNELKRYIHYGYVYWFHKDE